jgi:hypothetical protein
MNMNRTLRITVVMLGFFYGSAHAVEVKLPADVTRFVAQREGCDHFRGEVPDPPNAQRMREIEREVHKLCTGTDKKLDKLKRKYARNQAVLKRLSEFEDNIEASPR